MYLFKNIKLFIRTNYMKYCPYLKKIIVQLDLNQRLKTKVGLQTTITTFKAIPYVLNLKNGANPPPKNGGKISSELIKKRVSENSQPG